MCGYHTQDNNCYCSCNYFFLCLDRHGEGVPPLVPQSILPTMSMAKLGGEATVIPHTHTAISQTGHKPPEAWSVHMQLLCPKNPASFKVAYKLADVNGIRDL